MRWVARVGCVNRVTLSEELHVASIQRFMPWRSPARSGILARARSTHATSHVEKRVSGRDLARIDGLAASETILVQSS